MPMQVEPRCPHYRSDGRTEWCGLADREHRMHERLLENFDRAISFSWLLEDITDRMAADCADPALVAELAALKARREQWAEG